MRFSEISVRNYKGLRDAKVSLSKFACIIGHNNSGKSTLLQSFIIFIEGKRLASSYFYDPDMEIVIGVTISDLSDSDLHLIVNSDHRDRIRAGLSDAALKLVRRYATDGTSKLRWIVPVPEEQRFQSETIDAFLKGKRPGSTFAEEIGQEYPELRDKVDVKTNQTQAKALITDMVRSLPSESMVEQESDLPTGYDASVRALLPDPIYIPAVKDFSDDIKTKDSTSFGKLIGILLNAIAPELTAAEEVFKDLNRKLNIYMTPDGEPADERLDAVKRIEGTVQSLIRDHFSAVDIELQIPPPEIKTILGSARVIVDDGIKGELDTKGDGLKRSVAFAILRSIAQLKRDSTFNPEGSNKLTAGFLLLFEEPELYLHPKAQRVLFEALRVISESEQVLVSTHSPLFFSPHRTETFIKMVKTYPDDGQRPFGRALPIDLSNLAKKAQFQLVNFEINNLAFFSRTIILVEGDTDHIVFPHMARALNPEWCVDREDVSICKVNGKYNIRRYKEFLAIFQVRVVVLADLDCLFEGFEQLEGSEDCAKLRTCLIARIDEVISNETEQLNLDADGEKLSLQVPDQGVLATLSNVSPLSNKTILKTFNSTPKRVQWDDLITTYNQALSGKATIEELKKVGNAFFEKQIAKNRQFILERGDDPAIEKLKHEVLIALRKCDVFLLSRGPIEVYLPKHVSGDDKPTRALAFCNSVHDRDTVLSLCDDVPVDNDGAMQNELEWVFSKIFGA